MTNLIDTESLEQIAEEIQAKWQTSGLFEGIYRDFTLEMIKQYGEFVEFRQIRKIAKSTHTHKEFVEELKIYKKYRDCE